MGHLRTPVTPRVGGAVSGSGGGGWLDRLCFILQLRDTACVLILQGARPRCMRLHPPLVLLLRSAFFLNSSPPANQSVSPNPLLQMLRCPMDAGVNWMMDGWRTWSWRRCYGCEAVRRLRGGATAARRCYGCEAVSALVPGRIGLDVGVGGKHG